MLLGNHFATFYGSVDKLLYVFNKCLHLMLLCVSLVNPPGGLYSIHSNPFRNCCVNTTPTAVCKPPSVQCLPLKQCITNELCSELLTFQRHWLEVLLLSGPEHCYLPTACRSFFLKKRNVDIEGSVFQVKYGFPRRRCASFCRRFPERPTM